MPEDDDIDDDTLAAFTKILSKVGPTWLTEQMKSQTAQKPSSEGPGAAGGGLEAFLKEALAEMKAANLSMAEKMEAMRELLTPEQLISLKSRPPALEKDGPIKNEPPKPADPPAKPRKRWL